MKNLGIIEKSVLKAATKQLSEYLDSEDGHITLSVNSINDWLKNNNFPFEIDSTEGHIEISKEVH